ncbi:hypothetical protein E4U55_001121 [Claviceps digitariae]|nr:hypothetical protein E4U55_001121 [Claviceps digitariae]
MVVKEFLDSDRVNFLDEDARGPNVEKPSLAWLLPRLTARHVVATRLLAVRVRVPLSSVARHYRETAAKFQKEWHVKEPHRDFAFAPHVKGRALISVVNNGLFYYGLKRDFALKKLSSDAPRAEVDALQVGIFGPLKSQAEDKSDEALPSETLDLDGDAEASRKRVQEQLSNGSLAKRPCLSNGYADSSVNVDDNDKANPPASTTPSANASALASASATTSASASAPSATTGIDYATPATSSSSIAITTTPATTAAADANVNNTNDEANNEANTNTNTNADLTNNDANIRNDANNDTNDDTISNSDFDSNTKNNHDAVPTCPSLGNSIDNRNETHIDTIHDPHTSNVTAVNTPVSNLATAPTPTPAPMDIDETHQAYQSHPQSLDDSTSIQDLNNNNDHAYPFSLVGEQLPPTVLRTDGPEQGTQVDKVEELTPDTTFIRLMDKDGDGIITEAATTPFMSPVGVENAPVLLQCEWNPRDPSVLAAAGTDALARVWTISRGTTAETDPDQVAFGSVSGSASLSCPRTSSPRAHTLLDPDAPRATTVTALSWTSDGTAIAVATDSGSVAAVNVWSADGVHMHNMEVSEPPVIKLSWNPSNTALLAISPEKGGALITVYYSSTTVTALTYYLPGHDIAATPLDATWTNDTDFLLTGGDVLLHLCCSETSIFQVRKFETKEDDCFTQVLFDWRSQLAATSSDKGTLDLWDESGERQSISAHQGAITTMAWQPLLPTQAGLDEERLIATGGEDCTISIWNARRPENKAKCCLRMDSPIVRLAFTPDGAFIAGATSRQVLIWKVDNHSIPRASWNRPPHPAWLSPKGSSESDEEDEHCLCWDVSGQKLAYGSNSRLAVINFSR